MASYPQGGIAHLQAQFLDQPQGQPVDPSAISLVVLQCPATIAGPWTYPGVIIRDLIGLYHYDWAVPAAQAVGDYTARWTGTVNGTERFGYETFSIVAGFDVITGSVTAWATPAEVLAITGTTVTSAQITPAQATIDVFAGVTTAAVDNVTARDRRLLRMATAYQTVWQIAQVDVLARVDVKDMKQDGADITPADPDSLLLAPLAARCIRRLSWKRSRSVRINRDVQRWPNIEAYAAAWMRDQTPENDWVPL